MSDYVYERGDIRMCRAPMCKHHVVFYDDKGWIHIPKESGYAPIHKAVPFKEHKHVLQFKDAGTLLYGFECRICEDYFSYGRGFIRRMLTGR